MKKVRTWLRRVAAALWRRRILFLVVIDSAVIVLFVPIIYTFASTRGDRYDLSRDTIASVPYHKVAMVFGAGVEPDNTPTPYLKHRIETAVQLYKANRVKKLLMTGDNSTKHHNEPVVMQKYAVELGVPAADIVLDYAGFSTYDSCYRAKAIFGLHDATLVTQGYHLPRAMVTCRGLGIRNDGVVANHPSRDYTASYLLREVASTDKMVLQNIFKPKPTLLGKPQPIN